MVGVPTSAFSAHRAASKRRANHKSICYYTLQITQPLRQTRSPSLYTHSAATYIGFTGSCIAQSAGIPSRMRVSHDRHNHFRPPRSARCSWNRDVQQPGAAESADRQRLGGYRRSAEAALRPDPQSRGNRERLCGPRKGHARSGHQRAQPRDERDQPRGQGSSGKHALRRAEEPLCACRGLPATACHRKFHFTPEFALPNRGHRAERAALLQCRGARSQHQDSAVSDQHLCQHARLQAARVLRSDRCSRTRSAQGELQRTQCADGLARARPRMNRILLKHKSLAYAAILLLALFSLFASAAGARELRIEKFDSKIVVSPKGVIDVTETIQVQFIGSWNGLYREIPVEYVSPQGLNYTIFFNVKRVTAENGHSLKFESSRERHYRKLKIYVPEAQDSRRTIIIEYSVSDALRFFEDHDELYWNVTGDEWDVPIQAARARVVLPEGTTGIRVNV